MRSELTDATITNINGGPWQAEYIYYDNGDMIARIIQSSTTTFAYDGHQMTGASDGESFTLGWDKNGNMRNLPVSGVTTELAYNWDNKLRHGQYDNLTIDLKYDPSGNRIWKQSFDGVNTTTRKYIVDIVGDLPVILLELDPDNNMNIEKTYIYGNSQILAQHDGGCDAARYFYLHDRLGSVRQVIDTMGSVVNHYTYRPLGELYPAPDFEETVTNPFKFTGQFYDFEINEYYLRARMYDPHIGRFTARDPVKGKFEEPLTLHAYLYCINDPTNKVDPSGQRALLLGMGASGHVTMGMLDFFGLGKFGVNLVADLIGYHTIILPFYTFLAEHITLGGSGGAGFVVAHRDQEAWNTGWSFGTMEWLSGGGGLTWPFSAGGAVTVDIGYSPEAQEVGALGGAYVEAGGSLSTPWPLLFGFYNAGFTVSWGIKDGEYTGISLWTASPVGVGTPGWGGEVHGFVGYSWVQTWFEH